MNVIVVGAGRLGTQVADVLSAAGNAVTLIEISRAVAAARQGIGSARQGPGSARLVTGDGCEPTVLEEAGVHAADLLVAATGEDEDNLVISLLAKRQFAVDRVVARINDGENTWLFDERWGVDVAVPSAAPIISLVEEATGVADTVALMRLGRAGVNIIETLIGAGVAAAGHPVAEVKLPAGCVVAAVIRSGEPSPPTPDYILRPGDEVIVIARDASETDVRDAFGVVEFGAAGRGAG